MPTDTRRGGPSAFCLSTMSTVTGREITARHDAIYARDAVRTIYICGVRSYIPEGRRTAWEGARVLTFFFVGTITRRKCRCTDGHKHVAMVPRVARVASTSAVPSRRSRWKEGVRYRTW